VQPDHLVESVADALAIVIRCTQRCVIGCLSLQRVPYLEHVVTGLRVLLQHGHQGVGHAAVQCLRYIGSPALAAVQQAFAGQLLNSLAQRRTRDAEAFGQLAFRGQSLARP
jgi:hypothetical protein